MGPESPIYQLIPNSPPLLVSLAVIALATLRFKSHPRVSLVAIAAFLVQILNVGGAAAYNSWVVRQLDQGATSSELVASGTQFALWQLFLNTVFLVLVAFAIFIGRRRTHAA